MDVQVKVLGLQELEARLSELDALGGQKLLRRVLRKIAKPLEQRARGNLAAHSRSGALARSIRIVTKREKGQQVAAVAVTSRARERTALYLHNAYYRRQRKGIFYGWMLDQGHRVGNVHTGSLSRASTVMGSLRAYQRGQSFGSGRVTARPWWTPAVSASESQAVSAFVGELVKAVNRMQRRATAKTANPDALVPE